MRPTECSSEVCRQADVAMIFRTHTPRTCPATDSATDPRATTETTRSESAETPLDEATVCVQHGRFIPCRKDGEHCYTSNPYWVKSVRDFQSSSIDGLTWEPATP